MRIALIGDIHFYRLGVWPWQLLGKRILGQTNLWLRRRHHFRRDLLELTLQRIREIRSDMVLQVGDVTTTALDGEFSDVANVFEEYLFDFAQRDSAAHETNTRLPGCIVPGNHDRYTFHSARRRLLEEALPGLVPSQFPLCAALTDRWHLAALDSAVPRMVSSRGRIGPAQLTHLLGYLSRLTERDGVVVLTHYPLLRPDHVSSPWQHDLEDHADLRHVIAATKAKVIFVHGHVHQHWICEGIGRGMPHVTDVNTGATCQISAAHPLGQGFLQLDLPEDPRDTALITRHIPRYDIDAFAPAPGADLPSISQADTKHPSKSAIIWAVQRVL